VETIETLREKLAKAGDKKTADSQRRTVKSSLSFHGTKRGAFNKLVAEFVEANQSLISLTPLYSLLVNLWKSNNFEERLFALHLLLGFRGLLGEREWVLLSDWADTLDNWVLSDWTGHVRAWLLRRYPERVSTLIQWCSAENPWKRRSAVVSVLIHEPEGGGPSQLAVPARQALRVAEAALLDRDPAVQRATAWIVREIARDVPEHAARLLDQYKWKAPKTVLRASADGLPERLRKELLEAMEKPEPPPPPPPPAKGKKKGTAPAAKPGGPAPKGGPAKTRTAPAKPPARGKGATAKPGARPKAAPAKPKRPAAKKPSKAAGKRAKAGGRARPAAKKPKGSARPKGKARRPAGKKRAPRSSARRPASKRPSSGARRPKPPGRRHR
jgi:3-methyladenine DNA glycosylase AlkD